MLPLLEVSLVPILLRVYLFSGLTFYQDGLCATKAIEITVVKCVDQIETRCSNIATFVFCRHHPSSGLPLT